MKRTLAAGLAAILLLGCLAGCQSTPDEPAYEIRYGSLEQDAIVSTALAYLARGSRIQYDDTRFSQTASPAIYRWQCGEKSLEDYTSQHTGYLNCAAFTYEVYIEALDYDIGAYTTAKLVKKGKEERIYTYEPSGEETEEEKEAVETAFRSNLAVGDIIVARYRDGGGHAMLYVGEKVLSAYNGEYDIIHSTGGNYNYEEQTEKFEENGTIQLLSTDSLFDPDAHRYVFTELSNLSIVRPLNTYEGGVPDKTMARMNNMEGILAEKLSSHTSGMTVNPGDTMTFTFSITNYGKADKVVQIKDTVPANATYVSGAETVKGSNLTWELSVPAGSTASVSYEVKVNENAAYGDVVYSEDSTVCGISVRCPKAYIEKTLTAQEQLAIQSAAAELSADRGVALADAIYTKAIGKTTGLPGSFEALINGIYNPDGVVQYILNDKDGLLDRIVPGMFGGYFVSSRVFVENAQRLEDVRTSQPYARDLIPGDIIVAVNTGQSADQELYLVLGDTLLDLMTGEIVETQPQLDRLLGYNRFAVLRPSMSNN